MQFFETQVFAHLVATLGDVFQREHRISEPIAFPGSRVIVCGSGGSKAAAERVDADNEVMVRVEWQAGPDHVLPPAGGRIFRRRGRVCGR